MGKFKSQSIQEGKRQAYLCGDTPEFKMVKEPLGNNPQDRT